MTIFYQDDQVTLYHASCMEELAWLEADALVTDPPYGMDYKSGWADRDRIHGDETTVLRDQALDLWGTTKPALVFGTWRAPRPRATRAMLIWDKGESPGMGDLALPWGSSFEEVYVLGGRGAEHWRGPRGRAVLRVNKITSSQHTDHATPKPVPLMQRLIDKVNPEYVIADPFVGSGATLVAAKLMGRRAIGVELDRQYCEDTARRLERVDRTRSQR